MKTVLRILALGLGVMVMLVSLVSGRVVVQGREEPVAVELILGEVVKSEEIHYYMAYPGVLPDHPLYFLKMMRDRLVEWLTLNPLRKAELLELYADKRLGAAKVLIEGNQAALGLETAFKAAAYQDRAVALVEGEKQAGKNVGDLANYLERATAKHGEILEELKPLVSEQSQAMVDQLIEKAKAENEKLQRVLER